MRRNRRPIWLHLTLSYVGVALLAVLILAGITAAFSERDVNRLVHQRRDELTSALLVDAASTYNTGQPGWADADLRPALDLAARSGTDVAVIDNSGAVVARTFANPQHASNTEQHPIVINGQRIGTLVVKFNGRGLVQSTDDLRRSLLHADVWAAGVAAVLALLAAVVVARHLVVPVRALTRTANAMSRGHRDARVGSLPRAPAELFELGGSFDRMADAMARHEQLRRDLVADVAHELRTPVAVLQANTEALIDGIVAHSPEQTASLHEQVLRLGVMVNDLQALASAEAAALQLNLAPCDLSVLADLAADAMAVNADGAGVTIDRRLESVMVDADPVRIHQIITNLLSNAIKFTPRGGTVCLSVDGDEGQARLSVDDTGAGIPAEQVPHIFERFWRGPQHADAPGTGIGLSIVAELVAAHHGTVSVDSTPDDGTRVAVSLPAIG